MGRFASSQKADLRARLIPKEQEVEFASDQAFKQQTAAFTSDLGGLASRITVLEASVTNLGVSLSGLAQQVAHNRMDTDAEVARLDGRIDAIDVDSEVAEYLETNLTDHLDELLPEPGGLPESIEFVTAVDFLLETVEKKKITLDARGRIIQVEDVL